MSARPAPSAKPCAKSSTSANSPSDDVRLLASERSAGKRFHVAGKSRTVEVLDDFDFDDTQIAFFSAGGSISADHAPRAADAGAVVIDNTSRFRLEDAIPLVVPEVNGHRIVDGLSTNIIANPNCSTIQMVVALETHLRRGRHRDASTSRPTRRYRAPGHRGSRSWPPRPSAC